MTRTLAAIAAALALSGCWGAILEDGETDVPVAQQNDTGIPPVVDTETDPPQETDTQPPQDTGTPGDTDPPEDTDPPADTDTGIPQDTGAPIDTGSPSDSGSTGDTGTPGDTAAPIDTGAPVDTGSPSDSGSEDTGIPAEDTGVVGTPDPSGTIAVTWSVPSNADSIVLGYELATSCEALGLSITYAPEVVNGTSNGFEIADVEEGWCIRYVAEATDGPTSTLSCTGNTLTGTHAATWTVDGTPCRVDPFAHQTDTNGDGLNNEGCETYAEIVCAPIDTGVEDTGGDTGLPADSGDTGDTDTGLGSPGDTGIPADTGEEDTGDTDPPEDTGIPADTDPPADSGDTGLVGTPDPSGIVEVTWSVPSNADTIVLLYELATDCSSLGGGMTAVPNVVNGSSIGFSIPDVEETWCVRYVAEATDGPTTTNSCTGDALSGTHLVTWTVDGFECAVAPFAHQTDTNGDGLNNEGCEAYAEITCAPIDTGDTGDTGIPDDTDPPADSGDTGLEDTGLPTDTGDTGGISCLEAEPVDVAANVVPDGGFEIGVGEWVDIPTVSATDEAIIINPADDAHILNGCGAMEVSQSTMGGAWSDEAVGVLLEDLTVGQNYTVSAWATIDGGLSYQIAASVIQKEDLDTNADGVLEATDVTSSYISPSVRVFPGSWSELSVSFTATAEDPTATLTDEYLVIGFGEIDALYLDSVSVQ